MGGDFTAGTVVFDAVAVNIEENLPQMQRTAVNIRVRNDGFVLFVLPLNAGFFGAADDNGNDIAGQLHQTDALVREDGRALLQLAHLQHIVDERQQVIGGNLHFFVIVQQQRLVIKVGFVHLQQTDNAVERCADIVTHAREKFGFGAVRNTHFIEGSLQTGVLLLVAGVHLRGILQQDNRRDHRHFGIDFRIKHGGLRHQHGFLYPADSAVILLHAVLRRDVFFTGGKALEQTGTGICRAVAAECCRCDALAVLVAVVAVGAGKRVVEEQRPVRITLARR